MDMYYNFFNLFYKLYRFVNTLGDEPYSLKSINSSI